MSLWSFHGDFVQCYLTCIPLNYRLPLPVINISRLCASREGVILGHPSFFYGSGTNLFLWADIWATCCKNGGIPNRVTYFVNY